MDWEEQIKIRRPKLNNFYAIIITICLNIRHTATLVLVCLFERADDVLLSSSEDLKDRLTRRHRLSDVLFLDNRGLKRIGIFLRSIHLYRRRNFVALLYFLLNMNRFNMYVVYKNNLPLTNSSGKLSTKRDTNQK